ncbi:hypothetical protein BTT_06970 [Bacillus thuringiensis serovar morrisoni str. 4AA1]|uniref:hypothetical protein n=1 Tax=Bacillus TaxID=1386 RepID=UPI0005CF7B97|nr:MULTISPECIES: hypothetical protein [Bacillus]ALJ98046.1 hypothetical protein BMBtp1_54 [Bacillus phage BMBtp1]AJQ57374.1 hypothetical protein SD98_03380 [Bacillus thuringiensis serovar morrisoni]MDR5020768.1 hypothetical protein [Bacillus thuringiensis]MEC3269115.1 hypothetical protein [Bacillus thuringiensis]MED3100441.1 hypothetical protein [Bacillus thuringiensis]
MSLITIVETKDIISIISDGQKTGPEGNIVGTGFQKFYATDNFFIAVGHSEAVARVLFDHFKGVNANKDYVKNLIDEQASQYNHDYCMVFGDCTNARPLYTVYNHFNNELEIEDYIPEPKSYLPIIMSSIHLNEVPIGLVKYKISQMVLENKSNEEIIQVQKDFHQYAANNDPTVNSEIFQHIIYKQKITKQESN